MLSKHGCFRLSPGASAASLSFWSLVLLMRVCRSSRGQALPCISILSILNLRGSLFFSLWEPKPPAKASLGPELGLRKFSLHPLCYPSLPHAATPRVFFRQILFLLFLALLPNPEGASSSRHSRLPVSLISLFPQPNGLHLLQLLRL